MVLSRSTQRIDKARLSPALKEAMPKILGAVGAIVITLVFLTIIGVFSPSGKNLKNKVAEIAFIEILTRFEAFRSDYIISPNKQQALLENDALLSGFVTARTQSVLAGDLYLYVIDSVQSCKDSSKLANVMSAPETLESVIGACSFPPAQNNFIRYMLIESKNISADVHSLWASCVKCGQTKAWGACTPCGTGISAVFKAKMDQEWTLIASDAG